MRHLDLPTWTNGGGLLLLLVVVILALAIAALVDARRPRCWACAKPTTPDPARIHQTPAGRRVLLCRWCHNRVSGGRP